MIRIGRTEATGDGPAIQLGRYRALDGSPGAELVVDVDTPHAVLVVGKRGYGKSYTLGVLAESLARTQGLAPVIVDPMGEFSSLAAPVRDGAPVPATVVDSPSVPPAALDPRSWCRLLGLSPESGAGALIWQAAAAADTLDGMRERITGTEAPSTDIRAAVNHVDLAAAWEVFDPDGLSARRLAGHEATVVDLSGLDGAPMNAVALGIAECLYQARVADDVDRLPWLLVDEATTFFDGVARGALETVLERGRSPGVSLVLATQRPGSVPEAAVSQSNLLLAHRLTSRADLDALSRARPTYLTSSLEERIPEQTGEALVVDDVSESVHVVSIRDRDTPHAGTTPCATDATSGSGRGAGTLSDSGRTTETSDPHRE
jgi:DNA helicase HerA-like ATPase